MAQNFTDDWFASTADAMTGLQQAENNDLALKSLFAGPSAPPNPVAGMPWVDTANGILKIRNTANTAWLNLFNLAAAAAYNLLVSVTAGSGLTGGGQLTSSITLAIASGGISTAHLGSRIVQAANIALGGVGAEHLQDGLLPAWTEFRPDDHYTISSTNEETIANGWFRCPSTPGKLRLGYRGRASGANLDCRLRVNGSIFSSYARRSGSTAAWAEVADCDISPLTPGAYYLIELRGKLTGSGVGYVDNVIVSHAPA